MGVGGVSLPARSLPRWQCLSKPRGAPAGAMGAGGHHRPPHPPFAILGANSSLRHLFFGGPMMSPLPPPSSDPVPREHAGHSLTSQPKGLEKVPLGEPGRTAAVWLGVSRLKVAPTPEVTAPRPPTEEAGGRSR